MQFLASIKKEYALEKYLLYGVWKVRRAVAQFRVSDHNLRVERDRWHAKDSYVPREDRLCTHCDAQQVQDEMHIFTCSWHETLRRRYNIDATDQRATLNDLVEARPNMLWYLYHVMAAEDDFCKSHD